jgi:hypothetical protein
MPEFRGRHNTYKKGERTILRRIQNQNIADNLPLIAGDDPHTPPATHDRPPGSRTAARRTQPQRAATPSDGDDPPSSHSSPAVPTSTIGNVGSGEGIVPGGLVPGVAANTVGHTSMGVRPIMPVLSVTPESMKEPAP